MLNHDAPAWPAAALMDRERAVGKALEPHGLTLIIFPAGTGTSAYGVASPGTGAVMNRFPGIDQVEQFTAAQRAGPDQEWRESCPRCWQPFLDSTEADMLRRLLDHITYEHLIPDRRGTPEDDTAPASRGVIRIEWPAPDLASPYAAMLGRLITITDAVTGEMITTVSYADITVRADAREQVTAELTMFTDADGEPLTGGLPVADNDGGGFRQGTFTYVVAEMRVRNR